MYYTRFHTRLQEKILNKCLQSEYLSAKLIEWYKLIKPLGGAIMAKCAICEKGAHFGNNVSHSHRKTRKMWSANVKSVKVRLASGASRKTKVCTSCLKSGRVERA